MEGVASWSHCIQVMWSMLTGGEVACTCPYMYSAGDVSDSIGSAVYVGMVCLASKVYLCLGCTAHGSCHIATVICAVTQYSSELNSSLLTNTLHGICD